MNSRSLLEKTVVTTGYDLRPGQCIHAIETAIGDAWFILPFLIEKRHAETLVGRKPGSSALLSFVPDAEARYVVTNTPELPS